MNNLKNKLIGMLALIITGSTPLHGEKPSCGCDAMGWGNNHNYENGYHNGYGNGDDQDKDDHHDDDHHDDDHHDDDHHDDDHHDDDHHDDHKESHHE